MNTDQVINVSVKALGTKEDKRIAVVDDEEDIRDIIKNMLEKEGYQVYCASGSEEYYKLLEKTSPHLTLMDLNLKGERGETIIEEVNKREDYHTNFVVITGMPTDVQLVTSVLRAHVLDFIQKPLDADTLKFRVEKALIDIENRYEARIDGLTGICNRGTFNTSLDNEIKRFFRSEDNPQPLSLIIMDIDDFKRYNDTYSHLEGDYVLKSLGGVLRPQLRSTDLFARYGGEEFALILPNTDTKEAIYVYDRAVYRFMEKEFKPEKGIKERITFSAGLATLDLELDSMDKLREHITSEVMIRAADKGLYDVKQHGKARLHPFNGLEPFVRNGYKF